MPLKVLHVFAPNFRQRFGGPVFNWQLYFSKWDDSSVEHLVLDTEAGKVFPAKEAFNFDVSGPQKISTRYERSTWAIRLLQGLRKYQGQYDFIHFHLIWWGSLLGTAWASRRGIPTIYESVLLGSDTPGAMAHERFGKLKLRYLRKFSSILAISDGIAADYLNHGFLPSQVSMQMNAMDTRLFQPLANPAERVRIRESFGLPADGFILLFTGSLIHRKGVDILVESFISAAGGSPNLFLWLVGPKSRSENPSLDEAFVSDLQKRLTDAGLADRVNFYGLIADRQTLAAAYQAADVFVFPSRQEGLPNVVLEAMACGLPVIVSDLPGLKNVIHPGQNGLVVPIGDVASLDDSIQKIVHIPERALSVGRQARYYIESVHSFPAWQQGISTLYHALAEKVCP